MGGLISAYRADDHSSHILNSSCVIGLTGIPLLDTSAIDPVFYRTRKNISRYLQVKEKEATSKS